MAMTCSRHIREPPPPQDDDLGVAFGLGGRVVKAGIVISSASKQRPPIVVMMKQFIIIEFTWKRAPSGDFWIASVPM